MERNRRLLALMAAAWVVADSYRGMPWLVV